MILARFKAWRARRKAPPKYVAQCETCGRNLTADEVVTISEILPDLSGEGGVTAGTMMSADYCTEHAPKEGANHE